MPLNSFLNRRPIILYLAFALVLLFGIERQSVSLHRTVDNLARQRRVQKPLNVSAPPSPPTPPPTSEQKQQQEAEERERRQLQANRDAIARELRREQYIKKLEDEKAAAKGKGKSIVIDPDDVARLDEHARGLKLSTREVSVRSLATTKRYLGAVQGRGFARDVFVEANPLPVLKIPHKDRSYRKSKLYCPPTFNESLSDVLMGNTAQGRSGDMLWANWHDWWSHGFGEGAALKLKLDVAKEERHDEYGKVDENAEDNVVLRLIVPLGLRNGMQVADVGCGNGHFLNVLVRHFHVAVTAIEPVASLLEAAKKNLEPGFFCQASAVDLSFLPDNAFDRVVCNYVLNFLPLESALKAVEELLRITKPGGYIMVGLLNHELKKNLNGETEFPAELWSTMASKLGYPQPLMLNTAGWVPFDGQERYSVYVQKVPQEYAEILNIVERDHSREDLRHGKVVRNNRLRGNPDIIEK